MKKSDKTREQLLNELEKSKKRIAELEESETWRKQAEERNRLEREILDLTNTLNHAANKGDSLHEIIELFNQRVKNVFSVNYATVYLLSQNREHLIMQNLSLPLNLMRHIEKLIGMDIPKVKIHLNAGSIYSGILQADKPRITNNLATIRQMMTECTESKALQKLVPAISRIMNYRSVLSVPLVVNGKAIGLVDMSSKETFSEFDMKSFMIFSEQFTLIVKRKHAEKALRIERDNLKNIFEAIEDGVYIVNQQYDIQYVNTVLVNDFGPYEGHKCYEYFHDLDDVCPWCKNADVLAGKTVRWEWFSSKNGKTYDLIDTPLKNPDGSISKLEIFRDITERKQAEEELKQKMKQLERFNKVVVDRELRMIELKREINDLLKKAGLEKKYSSPD